MQPLRPLARLSTLILLSFVAFCTASAIPALAQDAATVRVDGHSERVGAGTVTTFARFDETGAPLALGIELTAEAVQHPPTGRSDEHQCTDIDDDGTVTKPEECRLWHEFVIPLPDRAVQHPDLPFRWALLNWNPEGHIPPQIYTHPHFDVHFYMVPIAEVMAIRSGSCGPEYVRCDQFERAKKPVPPNYVHPDFKDVSAVAPAMGNHLIDVSGPEFHGETFDRTWIFGAYDGRITFYEEMVSQAYLLTQPNNCFSIKQPEGFERAGYYPTRSCIRYDEARDRYRVVMEDFRMREASPPAPITAATDPAIE